MEDTSLTVPSRAPTGPSSPLCRDFHSYSLPFLSAIQLGDPLPFCDGFPDPSFNVELT